MIVRLKLEEERDEIIRCAPRFTGGNGQIVLNVKVKSYASPHKHTHKDTHTHEHTMHVQVPVLRIDSNDGPIYCPKKHRALCLASPTHTHIHTDTYTQCNIECRMQKRTKSGWN